MAAQTNTAAVLSSGGMDVDASASHRIGTSQAPMAAAVAPAPPLARGDSVVGGFVQGADLQTGAGWQAAVSAHLAASTGGATSSDAPMPQTAHNLRREDLHERGGAGTLRRS